MKISGRKLSRMPATPVAFAVLTLALAGTHGAMAQKAAAADDDVVVKGAVDHYDGQDHARKPETPAQTEVKKKYSPYAGLGPAKQPQFYGKNERPVQVFFGDTHHHTANSGDAFMAGDRLTPEQAYRFARGEEVISSSGVPAKLSRPLDFLVVSDHAEGLGLMFQVYEGNPAFMQDPILIGWNKAMKEGGKASADAANDVTSRQAQGTLPPVFSSYLAIQAQSFSGSSLCQDENGMIWSALSLLSRNRMLRCRLLPPGTEVHS